MSRSVPAFRGVAIFQWANCRSKENLPPPLPTRSTDAKRERRSGLAYANDNYRVQARRKDQLIVPWGERYVCIWSPRKPIRPFIFKRGKEGGIHWAYVGANINWLLVLYRALYCATRLSMTQLLRIFLRILWISRITIKKDKIRIVANDRLVHRML